MFIVNVILKVQKGKEEEFENSCKSVFPQVEKEEGTITYTLHKSVETPGTYFFYEKYKEKKDFDAHVGSPYIQNLLEGFKGLLEADPDISIFEEVVCISK